MSNELNMVALLKRGLADSVKNEVTQAIVAEQLKEFEVTLREKLKPIVDRINFESIESVRDLLKCRDELHVFLHYGEGGQDQVVEKTYGERID